MSVTMGDPGKMPRPRRPRTLGGEGRDPLFRMSADLLAPELVLRPDELRPSMAHACVTPVETCRFEEYQDSLYRTQPEWEGCP